MRHGSIRVSVAAIVLAAGASTRLGRPKQLERLGGETLLERAARVAREAGCSPVVVVLGAHCMEIMTNCSLSEVVTVVNDDWQEGMSSSIRLGVHAVRNTSDDAEGILVMTCDQPAVTPEHLRSLMAGPRIRSSRYAERSGVPAFFPRQYFDALTSLKGDAGARDLLRNSDSVALPRGELDVDQAGDLEQARLLFEKQQNSE
jgi:molybdenum cofactor cytidylyltransferase